MEMGDGVKGGGGGGCQEQTKGGGGGDGDGSNGQCGRAYACVLIYYIELNLARHSSILPLVASML